MYIHIHMYNCMYYLCYTHTPLCAGREAGHRGDHEEEVPSYDLYVYIYIYIYTKDYIIIPICVYIYIDIKVKRKSPRRSLGQEACLSPSDFWLRSFESFHVLLGQFIDLLSTLLTLVSSKLLSIFSTLCGPVVSSTGAHGFGLVSQ